MRIKLMWAGCLLAIAVVASNTWHKEQILAQGHTILLQLRPVDPRSLLQGGYMVLRYRMADSIAAKVADSRDGLAVVSVDPAGAATFVRVWREGEKLAAGERLLKFRKRSLHVRIASSAYFFQEGHAHYYEQARYGAIKVSSSGTAVLVGLYDSNHALLRAPAG